MSYQYTNNFARILAKENILIRRSALARTASFNMKTRLLLLPVWENISEELHDMVLVHEVGHALDTPFDGLVNGIVNLEKKYKTPAVKDYINVVEDSRVDRKQKVRYPGTLMDYALGYKELYTRNFFGIAKAKDVNQLPFIDRLNLSVKNGHHLGLKFNPAEQVLVDAVSATDTFDDVLDVTEAIIKYVQLSEGLPQSAKEVELHFAEEDEAMEGEGEGEGGDEEEGNEEGNASATVEGISTDDNGGTGQGASKKEDKFKELKEVLNKAIEDADKNVLKTTPIPEADTYRALMDNLDKKLSRLTTPEPSIVNVSVSDYQSVTVPYKKLLRRDPISDHFRKWRDEEKPNVAYMVSEFERRKAADIHRRVRVDKTGVLNMTGIHRYKYSDDIFKRLDVLPEGKNHGLIFLLDWSGSMAEILHETMKQVLVLTMFCRMTNIPFDVYAFQTAGLSSDFRRNKSMMLDETSTDIVASGFALKNILSSKMTANEYLTMSSFMFEKTQKGVSLSGDWSLGSTPLISALDVLPNLVSDFISQYKVQVPTVIVLTDGDSDMPNMGIYGRTDGGYVFNNPKTKKSYNSSVDARDVVGAMVENLRDSTGARVVGIHLLDTGKLSCRDRYKVPMTEQGFLVTKERGYDTHYAVKTNQLTLSRRGDSFWSRFGMLDSDKLADALSSQAKDMKATRFLLKSFIDDISLDRTT
tara:strand:+ start:2716 stop:4809 length:2094 start_codon:yes stop_codon:yes gene_type:complete